MSWLARYPLSLPWEFDVDSPEELRKEQDRAPPLAASILIFLVLGSNSSVAVPVSDTILVRPVGTEEQPCRESRGKTHPGWERSLGPSPPLDGDQLRSGPANTTLSISPTRVFSPPKSGAWISTRSDGCSRSLLRSLRRGRHSPALCRPAEHDLGPPHSHTSGWTHRGSRRCSWSEGLVDL